MSNPWPKEWDRAEFACDKEKTATSLYRLPPPTPRPSRWIWIAAEWALAAIFALAILVLVLATFVHADEPMHVLQCGGRPIGTAWYRDEIECLNARDVYLSADELKDGTRRPECSCQLFAAIREPCGLSVTVPNSRSGGFLTLPQPGDTERGPRSVSPN